MRKQSIALAIRNDRARLKAAPKAEQAGPPLLTEALNNPAPKKLHGFALWAKLRATNVKVGAA